MMPIPSESQEELEKLERKHAENPEGRYFVPLANAYRRAGDLQRAKAVLQEGLRNHPEYLSAHIVLGRCLADEGESRAAEAEFRFVLSLDPQNLIALRTLGELAVVQGKLDEGRKWYHALVAVDPMNEDARRALETLEAAPADAWDRQEDDGRLDGVFDPAAEESMFNAGSSSEDAEPAAPQSDASDQWISPLGLMMDLDSDGDEQDELAGDAVVTETIADLYTRQGFYDRAATVYRELIRRRGGDPDLEERLRRVERLAAGGTAAPVAAEDEATEVDEQGDDPFAETFSAGFPADEESALVAEEASEGALPEGGQAAEEDRVNEIFGAFSEIELETMETEMGASPALGSQDSVPASDRDVLNHGEPAGAETFQTIRQSLRGVLAWTPDNGADEAADGRHRLDSASALEGRSETSDSASEPPDSELGSDLLGEPGLPWLGSTGRIMEEPAAPLSEEELDGESVAPAPDDDELFPWELPGSGEVQDMAESHEVAEIAPLPGLMSTDAEIGEDAAGEEVSSGGDASAQSTGPEVKSALEGGQPAVETETPSETPVSRPPESSEEPVGEADSSPEADDEDDDLESFQAWLRSLRR